MREVLQTLDLDRHGRPRRFEVKAACAHQRANASADGSRYEGVAHPQGAVLHQHGRDTSPSAVQLCLQHHAAGQPFRIGFEILEVGHEEDHLEQEIEIGLLFGRNRHRHDVTAPVLSEKPLVRKRLLDPINL